MSRTVDDLCDVIRSHVVEHGYPPTMREIAERMGLSSTASVASLIERGVRQGRIQKVAGQPRTLRIVEAAK